MDAMKQRFGIQDDLERDHNRGRDRRPHRSNDAGEEPSARIAGKHHRAAGRLSLVSRATPRASRRLRASGNRRVLLDRLRQREDCVLALLTRNLVRGAEIKLSHYSVWDYFEFGAFADDHHDRNELPKFARARALETHGKDFPPERVFVIGDTPRDIECGKAVGAKNRRHRHGKLFPRRPCGPQTGFLI